MKSLMEILESPETTTTLISTPVTSEKSVTDPVLENSTVEIPYPEYMLTEPGAVGYETVEIQNDTYGFALHSILPITGKVSILDIGAGRGDLERYINRLYPALEYEYTGYEINPMLAAIGNRQSNIINDDFLNADSTKEYDYAFLIGSLNVNYGWDVDDWTQLELILTKALELTKKSVTLIMLHDNGGFDMYNSFPIPNLTDLILKFNYSFIIDFDNETGIYKLTIKK